MPAEPTSGAAPYDLGQKVAHGVFCLDSEGISLLTACHIALRRTVAAGATLLLRRRVDKRFLLFVVGRTVMVE